MGRFIVYTIVAVIAWQCGFIKRKLKTNNRDCGKTPAENFKSRATLIEQTATNVKLRTEDGREVNVPLQRLSQTDQDHLKSLSAPTDNPFAGGTPIASLPSVTSSATPARPAKPTAPLPGTLRTLPESKSVGDVAAMPSDGTKVTLSAIEPDMALAPDPAATVASPPKGIVTVSAIDAYDVVSVPVAADSAEGVFFLSIGRNVAGRPAETRGRIFAAELRKKAAKQIWDTPSCVRVVDHDPVSGRTLIVDNLDIFQRGGDLVMVEGLLTGTPKQLYRRTLPGAGKPGFAPQVEWAKLLSGSHVAAIVDRNLYVWDLPAAKVLYSLDNVPATHPPALSGSQRYMAVPQNGRVWLLETVSGNVVASLNVGSTPGVAFHPDGRQLALCFSNEYQVWDYTTQTVLSEATTVEHLGSNPIHWVGPKMFRTGTGDVIHLDLGMPVWKYAVSGTTAPNIVGNKFVCAATNQSCVLSSAEIPHPPLEQSVRQLANAGEKAMLVQPGSAVAIAVESSVAGVQADTIKEALSEAVDAAGWKVSDKGAITLVAKIGRGKTQDLRFENWGSGTAAKTESTAKLTPFTAELEIRRGSNVLWKRNTMNYGPSMLFLKQGETLQEAVSKYEKPDADFFARLKLPPRIPKPEITEQVGSSVLTHGAWQDTTKSPTRRPRTR